MAKSMSGAPEFGASQVTGGNSNVLLQASDIVKRFPGVVALNHVNLSVLPGEILALIGENGAGKSTLMKILAGIQLPDEGQVFVDGRPVKISSVKEASKLGISLIHQELNLADNLDVQANLFLGHEPHFLGFVNNSAIRDRAAGLLARVGLDIDPRTPLSKLSVGQQQLVEIAKALSVDSRVLIMDEPTASLSHREALLLFKVVEDLRARGVSVVYIYHRLGEIQQLADRVIAFRDGKNSGELPRDEITHAAMVQMMVGRDVSKFYHRSPHLGGDVVLNVDRVVTSTFPAHEASFQVRKGEIVGISGLVGAGRTELLLAIFGIHAKVSGRVSVAGTPLRDGDPRHAVSAGLGLVPEDRKEEGLVIELPVDQNLSLPSLGRYQHLGGLVNFAWETEEAEQRIAQLSIKTPSRKQIARFLSGGNQQKVVIGKWLAMEPKVLLLDEPTRGVDIGAKEEIYRLMDNLAKAGMAVVFVSSEMEEIIGVSDRVLVMHEGQIRGELSGDQVTEEAVMRLAVGNVASV
jgi:ribose transport system ATP-binding protein